MPSKFYQNEKWLRRKYNHDRLSPQEIAKVCGVEPMTIYRYLRKFGLIK